MGTAEPVIQENGLRKQATVPCAGAAKGRGPFQFQINAKAVALKVE